MKNMDVLVANAARYEVKLPFEQVSNPDNHTSWRVLMAQHIAMELDYELFGVKSIYLIGSVERGESGLCSDIDLLIHVGCSKPQRELLLLWLEGWSKALALTNYLRTGIMVGDLLDIHLVTDEEVRLEDSFAVKMRDPSESLLLIGRS